MRYQKIVRSPGLAAGALNPQKRVYPKGQLAQYSKTKDKSLGRQGRCPWILHFDFKTEPDSNLSFEQFLLAEDLSLLISGIFQSLVNPR